MRPLTEAERRDRQDQLADLALGMFLEVGYAGTTIAGLARRAGVGKGTVFLAFASKEALFLHAAGRRVRAWMARLAPLEGPAGPLAAGILRTLQEDPALLPLLALVHPVLEQACGAAQVLAFKRSMGEELGGLVQVWSARWPWVPAEAWWPLLMRAYAAILGAWSMADTSEALRPAMSGEPDLARFLVRFEDLLVPMLEGLLAQAGLAAR